MEITLFLQGISIKPLVRFLQINLQEEKDLKLVEEINTHVSYSYFYNLSSSWKLGFMQGWINDRLKGKVM